MNINRFKKQRISLCHIRLIFEDPEEADAFMATAVGAVVEGNRVNDVDFPPKEDEDGTV